MSIKFTSLTGLIGFGSALPFKPIHTDLQGLDWVTGPRALGSTQGLLVPSDTTAHVKGAWVELSASLPNDVTGIFISNALFSLGGKSVVDIGIGAVASEVVLVPELFFYTIGGGGSGGNVSHFIPINIAAGTRVAMRCQSASAGPDNYRYSVNFLEANTGVDDSAYTVGENIGVNVGATTQVVLATLGIANSKGNWIELKASLTNDIEWVCMTMDTTGTIIDINQRFDIGIGAVASEVVVVGDIPVTGESDGDNILPGSLSIPLKMANGSRVSARLQSTATGGSSIQMFLSMVGIGSAP